MENKREYGNHHGNGKRLDQLEDEFKTLIAKYRGEDCGTGDFDEAAKAVDAALYRAACAILRHNSPSHVDGLAQNAKQSWWALMTGGGFVRFDGKRPFGPYAFKTLMKIALGRDNGRDLFGRQTSSSSAKREQPDWTNAPPRKAGTDRRQVPLDFEPIDPRTTDEALRRKRHADAAWTFMAELPPDQWDALLLAYFDGANLSQIERERGLGAGTLHSRVLRAKANIRRQHPDFDWQK